MTMPQSRFEHSVGRGLGILLVGHRPSSKVLKQTPSDIMSLVHITRASALTMFGEAVGPNAKELTDVKSND